MTHSNFFAVCLQETGEEGILHPEPGETREQLRDRIPDEWRFRYFDAPHDYSDGLCRDCRQDLMECQC